MELNEPAGMSPARLAEMYSSIPKLPVSKPNDWRSSDFTRQEIESEIRAYDSDPSLGRLARIHDLAERHRYEIHRESGHLSHLASFGARIREHFQSNHVFSDIWERSFHLPNKRFFMWKDEVDHLARMARTKGGEIGGGARFIDEGKRGIRIETIFSFPHSFADTIPMYLHPFLSTKADVLWHTHPAGYRPHLSHPDIVFSRKMGIPILVTGLTKEGKPMTEIHVRHSVFSVRTVRRPFGWLWSMFSRLLNRLS